MPDWRRIIADRLADRRLSPEAIEELANHLDDRYQDRLARGDAPSAALEAALDSVGALQTAGDHLDLAPRRPRPTERLRMFLHVDLRDALRQMKRTPGFTAIALVVLAIGLGANAAIFSLIDGLLFRPLPVRAPDELVFVQHVDPKYVSGVVIDDYERFAARTGPFAALAGFGGDSGWARFNDRPEHLSGAVISPNYLDVLGVGPEIGRGFRANENAAGAAPTLLISDDFWRTHFDRDPRVLGRTIRLQANVGFFTDAPARDYTIVGVLPAGFSGTGTVWRWSAPDYWVLPHQREVDYICRARIGSPGYPPQMTMFPVGRLADGVTFDAAARAVSSWREPARRQDPGANPGRLDLVRALPARLPYEVSGSLLPERLATALAIVTGLVLVIAAANLVGLLMARGVTSQSETAIRLALGASRWRVARHALTHSLLLTSLGGILGLAIAAVLVKAFLRSLPIQPGVGLPATTAHLSLSFSGPVLLGTALLSLAAGLIVGLLPARQAARTDVLHALQSPGGGAPGRRRLRHLIVIPQIAVALMLLLVTGAIARTLATSELSSPGYESDAMVAVKFAVPMPDVCALPRGDYSAYRTLDDRRVKLGRRVRDRLAAVPSLRFAALSAFMPFESMSAMGSSVVSFDGLSNGQHFGVRQQTVSTGYFQTMGIPMIEGRDFTDADISDAAASFDAAGALIVSRALASELWPGRPAVGQLMAIHRIDSPAPKRWAQVVGVVDDVLPAITDGWPAPTVYKPGVGGADIDTVVARVSGTPGDAIRDITKVITDADASAFVVRASTVQAEIASRRYTRRVAVVLLSGAALVGLALAAIGLYGIVSFSLAQRLREFGVRAALGAGYRDLVALVIGEGLLVAAAGSALGIAGGYAAIGLVSAKLVAIPSINAAVFVGGPAIVFGVVVLACYLPARRASAVDPMIVLRGL